MRSHSFHALVAVIAGCAFSKPSLELAVVIRAWLVHPWISQLTRRALSQLHDDNGDTTDIRVECLDYQASSTIPADFHNEDILESLDSTLNITFAETSAHIDLEILDMSAWKSDNWSVGVVLYVDLIFDLAAQIGLQGGFVGKNYERATTSPIPWQVSYGGGTLKADLRLRTELGASYEKAGLGAAAEVGVYVIFLEIIADVEYDPTAPCTFEMTGDLGYQYCTFGATPAASTTSYTGSTWSQCWNSAPPTTSLEAITSAVGVATPKILPTTSSGDVTKIVDIPTPYTLPATATEDTTMIVNVPTPNALPTSATWAVLPNDPTPAVTAPVSTKSDVTQSGTLVTSKKVNTHHYANSATSLLISLHTSTFCSTRVYTTTSCASSITNCPASWTKEYNVTETIDLYTIVCPVTTMLTAPSAVITTAVRPRKITITNSHTLSSCPTPIVGNFEPAVNAKPPTEHKTTVYVHITTDVASKQTGSIFRNQVQASETTVHRASETEAATISQEQPITPSPSTTSHSERFTPIPYTLVEATAGASGHQSTVTMVGAVVILRTCLWDL
ncbi:Fc.00g081190.m01.CDS01 [Cosmosporella sp. VM-42]